MKTLMLVLPILALAMAVHAVDGVIEINSASIAAAGGPPLVISNPGSYRLTGNLSGTFGNCPVIDIQSDNVTLDLNGFEIDCLGFMAIQSTNDGVTVRNGSMLARISLSGSYSSLIDVRLQRTFSSNDAMGDYCTILRLKANGGGTLTVGDHCTIANSRFASNLNNSLFDGGAGTTILDSIFVGGDSGVSVGDGSLIRDSEFSSSGGGLIAPNSRVINNTIRGNSSAFRELRAHGSLIQGNVITTLSPPSLQAVEADDAILIDNVIGGKVTMNATTAYSGNHINGTVTGGIETGTNVCNGNTTCP